MELNLFELILFESDPKLKIAKYARLKMVFPDRFRH